MSGEIRDDGTASFAGFARLLGCRRSYVTELKAAGRLVLTADGRRVLVADSRRRIDETRDPAKAAVAARHEGARGASQGGGGLEARGEPHEGAQRDDTGLPAPGGGGDRAGNTYQAARAVKERYLAMSAKRDYERAMGKLMEADQVLAVVSAAATTLRSRLEGLPDILGPRLAALRDEGEIRVLLSEALEQALADTSRHFASLTNRDPLQ